MGAGSLDLCPWERGVERFLDESRRTNTESVTAARKLRIDIVFCINLFNVTILVHILSPHSPIFSTFLVLLPFSLPHTCEILICVKPGPGAMAGTAIDGGAIERQVMDPLFEL